MGRTGRLIVGSARTAGTRAPLAKSTGVLVQAVLPGMTVGGDWSGALMVIQERRPRPVDLVREL
jgi:hypothetical protein